MEGGRRPQTPPALPAVLRPNPSKITVLIFIDCFLDA